MPVSYKLWKSLDESAYIVFVINEYGGKVIATVSYCVDAFTPAIGWALSVATSKYVGHRPLGVLVLMITHSLVDTSYRGTVRYVYAAISVKLHLSIGSFATA